MALKRSTLVYYGLTDILAVRIVDVITDPLCGYLGDRVVIWNYPITREKHAEVSRLIAVDLMGCARLESSQSTYTQNSYAQIHTQTRARTRPL